MSLVDEAVSAFLIFYFLKLSCINQVMYGVFSIKIDGNIK